MTTKTSAAGATLAACLLAACASTQQTAPDAAAQGTADAPTREPQPALDAARSQADTADAPFTVTDTGSRDGAAISTADAAPASSGRAFLYVNADVRIRTFALDPATGVLTEAGMIVAEKNPMYLRAAPSQKVLYAAIDANKVAAYAVDAGTGALTLLNTAPSPGGPPYVDVHPKGTFAATANWAGGTGILFPLDPDGRLGEGISAMTGMQSHSARFHPSGRHLYVCSVAGKQITRFTIDEATGRFTTAATPLPGLGPRHMAFTPDGRFAYVLHERPIRISMLSVDAGTGALTPLGEVSALRPGAMETNSLAAAEIAVSASGRYVYASVRDFTNPAPAPANNQNTIAVYAVDPGSGKLTPIEFVASGGTSPRGFVLGPGDRHLFVANELSKELVTFVVDAATGKLTRQSAMPTGGASIGIAIVQPR